MASSGNFCILNPLHASGTGTPNFGDLKNYMNCVTNIAGIKKVIVASTGYTGAGGYEIYCNNKK